MDSNMKEFYKWHKQYTDKKNFDRAEDNITSGALLFSLWTYKQIEIDKLKEGIAMLRDLRSTTECKKTWVDEMQGTIDEYLKELEEE